MRTQFKEFLAEESGVISAPYVFLTAAVTVLAMTSLYFFNEPIEAQGERTSAVMENYQINQDFDTQTEVNGLATAAPTDVN